MPTETMRVGLVQQRASRDPEVNLGRAAAAIREAAAAGADLVCLQELFRTPYLCATEDVGAFDLAEPIPGPSTHALAEVARQEGVVIVASLFERRAPGLYHNTAAVIDADGALLGIYRKMHIPDDPGYYEKFYFAPGDLGFRAFDTRAGRIGALICWDQWYPEAARLTALEGAGVLLYPTAIGWGDDQTEEENAAQREAWEVSMRAHAVHNGVYVVAVNRTGREGTTRFWGSSFVADTFGGVLYRAPVDGEAVATVELDLRKVEEVRRHWPFLRDRRIDAYAPIARRFGGGA